MRVSRRIAASQPLATTAMHGRVEALKLQGLEVIDFSIAISHFPAPAAVLDAVATELRRPLLPYTAVGGAAAVRSRLADKLRGENRIDAGADEIIVTNGAKQALYEALYVLTDPGDSVIVFRPHWPAYVATAQLLGLKVLLLDLPERIDAAFVAALPPARVLIINNPHNPTGKVYQRDELALLRGWLAGRDRCAIVDEGYEKLIFDGEHISLAACPDWRELGIVTIFSASQSHAMMGWRAGFALAPAAVIKAMDTLQGPITAAASALTQIAADAAFSSPDPAPMRADYRSRRDLVLALFAGVAWITLPAPDSGPYLWGDISGLTRDTVAFAEALLAQHSVAIMPGEALGVAGWIRIGYIADDVATLTEGVRRIIAFGDALAATAAAAAAPAELAL
jgi:aspartate aminotransferase